ncbi:MULTISPECIES: NADH-quinone oxidoreductase subunit C [Anaerolinea]|uniref:NADH-quinone oxidoreductase subunit C n=1 Tax=Anaerolinea TaxID=233189 RepID=UPI002629A759|nr:NADH-quinone oxidoreductase subunit C [Anaerolinea thermophila]
MDEKMRTVVEGLQSRFNLDVQEFRGEVTLIVPPEHIVSVAQSLRDDYGFEQLVDVTAVDYFPQLEPRFHVVYHIRSLAQTLIICLRVPLNGNYPSVSTVEKVYPGANWYEREVYDMFGITFEGHSDLRRILMPYDWQGHPLRKDYPLGYEEVQFSFNIDEVLKRKLRPQE